MARITLADIRGESGGGGLNFLSELDSCFSRYAPHPRRGSVWKMVCPSCNHRHERGGYAIYHADGAITYACYYASCKFNKDRKPRPHWCERTGMNAPMRELFSCMGGNIDSIDPRTIRKPMTVSEAVEWSREKANRQAASPAPPKEKPLPEGSMPIMDAILDGWSEAYEALEGLIERCSLYEHYLHEAWWSPAKGKSGSVILPCFEPRPGGFAVMGHYSRKMVEDSKDNEFGQSVSSDFLYRSHILDNPLIRRAFVVESPLDAVLLRGLATGGASMSQRQCEALEAWAGEVILVPDKGEAEESAWIQAAEKHGFLVSMPDWDFKDPGEAIAACGEDGDRQVVELLLSCAESP